MLRPEKERKTDSVTGWDRPVLRSLHPGHSWLRPRPVHVCVYVWLCVFRYAFRNTWVCVYQQGGVSEQGASDGDTLALPSTEPQTPLAHQALELLRELHDEVVRMSVPRRLHLHTHTHTHTRAHTDAATDSLSLTYTNTPGEREEVRTPQPRETAAPPPHPRGGTCLRCLFACLGIPRPALCALWPGWGWDWGGVRVRRQCCPTHTR